MAHVWLALIFNLNLCHSRVLRHVGRGKRGCVDRSWAGKKLISDSVYMYCGFDREWMGKSHVRGGNAISERNWNQIIKNNICNFKFTNKIYTKCCDFNSVDMLLLFFNLENVSLLDKTGTWIYIWNWNWGHCLLFSNHWFIHVNQCAPGSE